MKDFATLISALASLLWPIIAGAVIFFLRPAVIDLIASAKRRKFTIKVGGQELSMDEANEQQQQLISDIQAQIIDLKNKLDLGSPGAQGTTDAVRAGMAEAVRPRAVLWVDDAPKNNSYLMEQLAQAGVSVDTALSTSEGIDRFRKGRYALVVSDMGRNEAGGFNPRAGMDLLKLIRNSDADVPFVVFTSARGYQEYREQATSLGATYVTSSTTDLAGIFRIAFGGV